MFNNGFIKSIIICILFLGFISYDCWCMEKKKEEERIAEINFITFHKIDKAWKYTRGKNTKVAILDWLFDLSPEASKKYINPTSLVPGQKIGFKDPWHGEWMAEIVHQIAPEAKIIPIRARPSPKEGDRSINDEQLYEKYLIQGIRFAADQGAVAVTNSMGPVKHCNELFEAVDYAEIKGTVFINVHPEYIVYTKQTFKKCKTGQCNKKIIHPGLVSVPNYPTQPAPNRDIYVWPYQVNPKYKDGWGYSNGPPIVAGVVALMKSVNPKLTPKEIKKIILETAYIKDGFKVLDAEAAVKEANGFKADSWGYAKINNVKLYYEISGKGEPLLYLHGGLSSSRDFEKYIPEFSKHFKVITVDRRGHGRSFDNSEPYSYSSMANDMNAFLEYLKIDYIFVIGWSDGGVVGYHLASKNPNKVKKLIAVGANYLVDGMTKSSIDWIKNQFTVENISKSYPQVKEEYRKLNPNPENFGSFINKTRNMWLHDPYISKEDFIKIHIPVLLVAGDRDDIRLEHMIEMHSLLNKSQLCIVPNTTHFIFDRKNDIITNIFIEFLQQEVDK